MTFPTVSMTLPDWLEDFIDNRKFSGSDHNAQMLFVVALARENVLRGTGGPFAAGVFDAAGRLVAPGVNLVTSSQCSVFHAEMVALMLAQKILGRFDLSNAGRENYTLISSVEPCAMCFGAIPWAGVTHLVCGAREADARAVGFDEGDKVGDWQLALRKRGISVTADVRRDEAREVLDRYAHAGGPIYNSRNCCDADS